MERVIELKKWVVCASFILFMFPASVKPPMQYTGTVTNVQGYEHTSFNTTSIGFDLKANDGETTCTVEDAILDTGSFTTIVPGYIADVLNLPNNGNVSVGGVTGSESGYYSKINLTFNGRTFRNVPCVVLPNSPAFLLGADFFRKYHLGLSINFDKNSFQLK